QLKNMVRVISGLEPGERENETDLSSLGFESFMLTTQRRKRNRTFEIDITLNEFFLDLTTLKKITDHIFDRQTVMEPPGSAEGINRKQVGVPVRDVLPVNIPSADIPVIGEVKPVSQPGTIEEIMADQMEAMSRHSRELSNLAFQQLETLKKVHRTSGYSLPVQASEFDTATISGVFTERQQAEELRAQPGDEPSVKIFPMSSVQRRLYALSQTGEGDRAYH
ncbi:MAG: acyl carrier protein, partial [bacterium]|nr:acyl carrier protein [bacterium]